MNESTEVYDWAVSVDLTTDEWHCIGRALQKLRDTTAADSIEREKADGSFWTDAQLTRLAERFPDA